MRITVDVSMYPLDQDFVTPIKDVIHNLRRCSEIELVTNQMSTQVRGDFDAVTAAVTACMKQAMQGDQGRLCDQIHQRRPGHSERAGNGGRIRIAWQPGRPPCRHWR